MLIDIEELRRLKDAAEAKTRPDIPKGRIEWITAKEIFAPLPVYPWLIEGLHIAPGRVTLLNGYADVGKTVVAMSLGLAVATGKPAWGVYKPTKTGIVLHLNGEIGSYLARERYQRLARGMGIDPDLLFTSETLRLAQYPPVRLDDEDFESELAKACAGCVLVIIDSLRAFSGGLNENAKEVGIALLMLGRVSEATGATILLLHHNRKPSKDDVGGVKMAISGSSSILGGSECAFVMTSAEKGGVIVVNHERSPLGKYLPDFGLCIEDLEFQGDKRWGLMVRHLEAEQVAAATESAKLAHEAASIASAEKKIIEALQAHAGVYRGGKGEFRTLVGIGMGAFLKALERLRVTGRVRQEGTYHQPIWILTVTHPD